MLKQTPKTTRIARTLRKDDSWGERLMWSWLRDHRFSDYKFRRQHPIGNFVALSLTPPSPAGRGGIFAGWLRYREPEKVCTTYEEKGADESYSLSQRERARVRENNPPEWILQSAAALSECGFVNACQPTDA